MSGSHEERFRGPRPWERWRLRVALLLLVAWFVFLIHETVTRANLPAVSMPEVLTAPIVVEGVPIEDPKRLEVIRIFRSNREILLGELLTVRVPDEIPWRSGGRSLIVLLDAPVKGVYPLWLIPGDPGVMPPPPSAAVYPAVDSVRARVKAAVGP